MKWSLLLCAMVIGCGMTCRKLEYHGVKYNHFSLGTKSNIGKLDAEFGTNTASVTVESYANDQVEGMGVVTEAAVRAAIKSVKP